MPSTPVKAINSTNPGISAVTDTLAGIPTGLELAVELIGRFNISGLDASLYISALDQTDSVPDGTNAIPTIRITGAANSYRTWPRWVRTDTSAQIRSRVSASAANVLINATAMQWIDRRGRDG